MTISTRVVTPAYLCFVVLFFTGCVHDGSSTNQISPPTVSTGTPNLPQTFLLASENVKKNFHYDNNVKPTWPPRRDIFGHAIGNCMTYSRLIRERLDALGFVVRFKNVLAPTAPREHVVAVATDHNGQDWVFDNKFPHPYLLKVLVRHYDLENFYQSSQVGAQRHKWVTRSGHTTIH